MVYLCVKDKYLFQTYCYIEFTRDGHSVIDREREWDRLRSTIAKMVDLDPI